MQIPKFNPVNENIDWAKWSWNPVTGCEHGCRYCYARDIANRFYDEGFEPTFRPDRLDAPQNTKIPKGREGEPGIRNVFVGSMADLFGDWVSQKWIDAVLEAVSNAPQWNFLFLTKNPKRMVNISWPANAWVGTTVDIRARVKPAQEAFRSIGAKVKFLSCEPLLENVCFKDMTMFDWLIIGGCSKTTKQPGVQPKWAWVEDLLRDARKDGLQVYFKPNLKARPREYPEL
jgi:protein gp37